MVFTPEVPFNGSNVITPCKAWTGICQSVSQAKEGAHDGPVVAVTGRGGQESGQSGTPSPREDSHQSVELVDSGCGGGCGSDEMTAGYPVICSPIPGHSLVQYNFSIPVVH